MSFFTFETEYLEKIFPPEKANLKEDFNDAELEAIDNLDLFRQTSPNIYLGKFLT